MSLRPGHAPAQPASLDLTFHTHRASRFWSTELGGPDPNVVSISLGGQARRLFGDCPSCSAIVPRIHRQRPKGGGVDLVIQYIGTWPTAAARPAAARPDCVRSRSAS